jgi:hypothetical protein
MGMTRREEFRRVMRVLFILAVPVLLFVSPFRLDAFPIQTFFADVNGDGHLEEVELFFEGTQNSIAVHVSRSNVSLYRVEAKISPFGRVLAGDFDHDADLDLIWLTGAGPDSVLLHNDGQGNFKLVDNTHLYASELRRLIDSERNAGFESQRSDVPTYVFTLSDHSKDLTFALAWYAADCIFRTSLIQAVDHSVRALPQYRFAGRSPPQPSPFHTFFSS